MKAGYIVSKPLADSYRYDLVIDDGKKLRKVQVRTGRLREGSVIFNCFSTHSQRGGGAQTRPYHGEVDFIAVHCPQTGKTYLIPESELAHSQMHLRVDPTVNRQDRHIHWAAQYELP